MVYLIYLVVFVCIQHTISVVTLYYIHSIIQHTIIVVPAAIVTPFLNDGLPLKFAFFSFMFLILSASFSIQESKIFVAENF